MAPLKSGLKKLLIGKQNIKYNKQLKSKKMDYNKWVVGQEQLQKMKNPLVGLEEKCQTIDIFKKDNEGDSKENDRKLAELSSLCKLIEIFDVSEDLNCKTQYLVCEAKYLSKAYEYAKDARNCIDAVILMNYDGEISKNAFLKFYSEFQKNKSLILIYSDEDMYNEGKMRLNPWYKPSWAPDDFLSYFYFGGLTAIKVAAMKEAEPKEDDDVYSYLYKLLILNNGFDLHNKKKVVGHIPEVLFHTFNVPGYEYAKNYKLRFEMKEQLKDEYVSIIIPSKDHPEILFKCIDSLLEITRVDEKIKYEIIIVDNGSNETNKALIESLVNNYSSLPENENRKCGFDSIQYIYEKKEFNFAYMCNLGARCAHGDYYLFLNDDMEIVEEEWLTKMVMKAHLPYAGCVGAKLLYPKSIKEEGDIIQHAGITNLRIGPAHKLQFMSDKDDLYYGRNRYCHDMMGVTGACLLVKKTVFNEVNGFDENLAVAFNDVDLCYSIYEKGYYNIQRNDVVLLHHESLSRGNDSESEAKQLRLNREKDYLYSKHQPLYGKDPFYNINLTTDMLESEYAPKFHYEVDLGQKWAKIQDIAGVIDAAREDKCVRVGMECAMDIFKWKYGVSYESGMDAEDEDFGFYFQGYTFVIGSDNACYERTLLLKNRASGQVFGIDVNIGYRPDIAGNVPDQLNVDLAGYNAKIKADSVPSGTYQFGMYMKDCTSSARLYNWSNWTIDIQDKSNFKVNENRI